MNIPHLYYYHLKNDYINIILFIKISICIFIGILFKEKKLKTYQIILEEFFHDSDNNLQKSFYRNIIKKVEKYKIEILFSPWNGGTHGTGRTARRFGGPKPPQTNT